MDEDEQWVLKKTEKSLDVPVHQEVQVNKGRRLEVDLGLLLVDSPGVHPPIA